MRYRFAFLLFSAFLLSINASAAPPRRPNLVLITLDTVRADRMGFMGSKRGLTPNLDSLARESLVFRRAYTQAPLTTVSHATILTGTYPQYHGVNDFGVPLPPYIPTVAEILKGAGYETAAFVGSLILDPKGGLAPGFDRGFDTYDAGYHIRRGEESRYASMERRAQEVVSRASKWLRGRSSRKPFFLWVHLYDAHDPYDPPQPYASRNKKEPYDGEVAYVDAATGTLTRFLRAQNLFASSCLIVTSDHGEALGQHGESTHGIFLYDETIHVPLLVKLPAARAAAAKPASRPISARVELVDIAPTLLEVAGLKVPSSMQGPSLLRLSNSADERPAYAETDYPRRAFGWSSLASLRTAKYLFVRAPRRELYDVSADAAATRNLAQTSNAVADTLAARLEDYRRRTESKSGVTEANLNPEQAQNLASLGYVAAAASRGQTSANAVDPKDKVEIANALHHAILATEDGRYEEAVPLLQKVLQGDPQIYIAELQLGVAYARRKDYGSALTPLRKAVELRPDSAMAQYELGVALFETGDWQSSVPHFEEAVRRMPKWADAHFSLASVYARTDRVRDALAELHAALELNPEHYRANLLLGRILSLQGHAQDALPNLSAAVKAQPDSREAHLFLADAYTQLGMQTEADRERAEAQRLRRP